MPSTAAAGTRKRGSRATKSLDANEMTSTAQSTVTTATAAAAAATMEMHAATALQSSTTATPTVPECRRSSRKKVIKFEVLDVLNKNRRSSKIQIEARIDSTPAAPATATYAPLNISTPPAVTNAESAELKSSETATCAQQQQQQQQELCNDNSNNSNFKNKSDAAVALQQKSDASRHQMLVKQLFNSGKKVEAKSACNDSKKRRGRPPKNKQTSDVSTQNPCNFALVKHEANTCQQLPLSSPTQADVVLEISSSSSCSYEAKDQHVETATATVEPAQHMNQRNFAAVFFVQEPTNPRDDSATSTEFIMASVEEISNNETLSNHAAFESNSADSQQTNSSSSPFFLASSSDDLEQASQQNTCDDYVELLEVPDDDDDDAQVHVEQEHSSLNLSDLPGFDVQTQKQPEQTTATQPVVPDFILEMSNSAVYVTVSEETVQAVSETPTTNSQQHSSSLQHELLAAVNESIARTEPSSASTPITKQLLSNIDNSLSTDDSQFTSNTSVTSNNVRMRKRKERRTCYVYEEADKNKIKTLEEMFAEIAAQSSKQTESDVGAGGVGGGDIKLTRRQANKAVELPQESTADKKSNQKSPKRQIKKLMELDCAEQQIETNKSQVTTEIKQQRIEDSKQQMAKMFQSIFLEADQPADKTETIDAAAASTATSKDFALPKANKQKVFSAVTSNQAKDYEQLLQVTSNKTMPARRQTICLPSKTAKIAAAAINARQSRNPAIARILLADSSLPPAAKKRSSSATRRAQTPTLIKTSEMVNVPMRSQTPIVLMATKTAEKSVTTESTANEAATKSTTEIDTNSQQAKTAIEAIETPTSVLQLDKSVTAEKTLEDCDINTATNVEATANSNTETAAVSKRFKAKKQAKYEQQAAEAIKNLKKTTKHRTKTETRLESPESSTNSKQTEIAKKSLQNTASRCETPKLLKSSKIAKTKTITNVQHTETDKQIRSETPKNLKASIAEAASSKANKSKIGVASKQTDLTSDSLATTATVATLDNDHKSDTDTPIVSQQRSKTDSPIVSQQKSKTDSPIVSEQRSDTSESPKSFNRSDKSNKSKTTDVQKTSRKTEKFNNLQTTESRKTLKKSKSSTETTNKSSTTDKSTTAKLLKRSKTSIASNTNRQNGKEQMAAKNKTLPKLSNGLENCEVDDKLQMKTTSSSSDNTLKQTNLEFIAQSSKETIEITAKPEFDKQSLNRVKPVVDHLANSDEINHSQNLYETLNGDNSSTNQLETNNDLINGKQTHQQSKATKETEAEIEQQNAKKTAEKSASLNKDKNETAELPTVEKSASKNKNRNETAEFFVTKNKDKNETEISPMEEKSASKNKDKNETAELPTTEQCVSKNKDKNKTIEFFATKTKDKNEIATSPTVEKSALNDKNQKEIEELPTAEKSSAKNKNQKEIEELPTAEKSVSKNYDKNETSEFFATKNKDSNETAELPTTEKCTSKNKDKNETADFPTAEKRASKNKDKTESAEFFATKNKDKNETAHFPTAEKSASKNKDKNETAEKSTSKTKQKNQTTEKSTSKDKNASIEKQQETIVGNAHHDETSLNSSLDLEKVAAAIDANKKKKSTDADKPLKKRIKLSLDKKYAEKKSTKYKDDQSNAGKYLASSTSNSSKSEKKTNSRANKSKSATKSSSSKHDDNKNPIKTELKSEESADIGNDLPKQLNEAFENELNIKVEDASTNSTAIALNSTLIETDAVAAMHEDANPFKDIEKFIEASVNLLKKDYKMNEDSNDDMATTTAESTLPESVSASATVTEFKQEETAIVDDNNSQCSFATDLSSIQSADYSESGTTASSIKSEVTTDSNNSSSGVRRSHRIKQISKPDALVGRGLVRDRERLFLKDDLETKSTYSLDVHLLDLAEVEAKNAKFLKDMEERLSTFEVIKENEYKCERVISREARKMLCDCFLTASEEERGELGCGEDCLNRLLMIECGANCNVKERCTNKRFQKKLCAPCCVFRTEKKGFGISADVEILPGEFIMEYVGEVIDGDEFEQRRLIYSREKNRHYYFMALRSDTIIDATVKGNISRFINHSCDPNAETQKWTVNGELRIGFFSRKSIMPGEEITFDYQYQRYGRDAQRCYCEAENCRGWIGEEPNSDEGEQMYDDSDEASDSDERKSITTAADNSLLPATDAEKTELEKKTIGASIVDETAVNLKKQRAQRKREKREKQLAKQQRQQVANENIRFLEDPDIENEVEFLSRCGLKNKADTLRLSRLTVRAKLTKTRLALLEVLRKGELPCRRLFLDYHGLRLLHGWMSEDAGDNNVRLALLATLETLPISNKTVLQESKVYQTVLGWLGHTDATANISPTNSDESSKDGSNMAKPAAVELADATTISSCCTELQTLAKKLIDHWNSLPEIFRIPKCVRIEQMKEHEREADMQFAATDANNSNSEPPGTDRYQRDRFRRNTNVRPLNTNKEMRKRAATDSWLQDESLKHLSKEQRRQLFAAKVARDEEEKRLAEQRRIYEFKCQFFGLDASTLNPLDLPVCKNDDTGQFYGADGRLLPRPPAPIGFSEKRRIQSTKKEDYVLQSHTQSVVDIMPDKWNYAISPYGYIYYYNEETGQKQWDPPSLEEWFLPAPPPSPPTQPMAIINEHVILPTNQLETIYGETQDAGFSRISVVINMQEDMQCKQAAKMMETVNSMGAATVTRPTAILSPLMRQQQQPFSSCIAEANKAEVTANRTETDKALIADTNTNQCNFESKIEQEQPSNVEIDDNIIDITTDDQMLAYLKSKYAQIRMCRYRNLVKQRAISPRRDEDIAQSKIEMVKYKLNKEKLRARKERLRKERAEGHKTAATSISNNSKTNESTKTADEKSKTITQTDNDSEPNDALPMQQYLFSSDEESNVLDSDTELDNAPLMHKFMQSDKIVDEVDALAMKRALTMRKLPTPKAMSAEFLSSSSQGKRTATDSRDRQDYKRRKLDKKDKSQLKKSKELDQRRGKEHFRCQVALVVVHYLRAYRDSNCQHAKIDNDSDFRHLVKKLTHFVTVKEWKYCESLGQRLVVTESVKNKTREFIKKYMSKYGPVYVKSQNDPQFKDLPDSVFAQLNESKAL